MSVKYLTLRSGEGAKNTAEAIKVSLKDIFPRKAAVLLLLISD